MRSVILIITIGFLPNIGGLETHLKDLIDELLKRNWKVVVLTYQPIHTPTLGKWIEKEKNLTVFRLPILRGLFYKFLRVPILEFLLLMPLFFLTIPIVLLVNHGIRVVNAQGISAGFAVAFWSKLFKKRYVISVQSIYNFPKKGLYRSVSKWIFRSADKIIAISIQAKQEIENLGISQDKIQIYTNWENSNVFKPLKKETAKKEVGFNNKFVVSFFARLMEEKGVKVVMESIELSNKRITFAIYGEGPLKDYVKKAVKKHNNAYYMGIVPPQLLPLHYSACDLVLMPTLSEEGFGRVAAGALFCGTPVIASNRGALPDVVNDLVGKIINPTPQEIAKAVNYFYNNRDQLRKRALKSRGYALNKFSSRNAEPIIKSYL